MGKKFGALGAKIRGIVYYKLSPHEMKPFAKAFSYGLPNFVPRALSRIETWLPPFITMYLVYNYVEWAYRQGKRKNPADYHHETDPDPPKICRRSDDLPRYSAEDEENETCEDD